jgi:uncharacterized phosphosugar-binding protein
VTHISENYLQSVIAALTRIQQDEQEVMDKAGQVLAEAVAKDRLINVIGPGGHSNMAVEEVFWRAGGLASVNALLDAGTNLIHGAKRSNRVERTPGYASTVLDIYGIENEDVLVIVNAYGINAMTIDCALECEKRGVTSIAITSTSFADSVPKDAPSRHPSGKNLYDIADIFINNHLPLGDAVVSIEGMEQKMGPLSTFVNSFAINLLMMSTAQKLLAMGIQPPIWTSANMPDGDKLNQQYEEAYFPRIKHLR